MYCRNNHIIKKFLRFLLILASCELTAISPAVAQEDRTGPRPATSVDTTFTIEILQAGWHTGIVLRTADVAGSDWPEVRNYLQSKYVDIGWGDERFYQAEGNPPLLAARAVIFPTRAVIHIVPFSISPHNLYSGVIHLTTIHATPYQYKALCRAVSDSFERDKNGQLLKSSLYDNNVNFFKAKGKYHLFNTCNTWVARCLQLAGFNVDPTGVTTGRQLATELEKIKAK
jgi:uncharacterized protein (TIGR02117 family)